LKALLVYQDPALPSSRIRILQLAPHLEQRGIACELVRWPRTVADKLRLRARARAAEVVILQKKLPTLIDAQIFAGARLVFDYDDAIMFRDREKRGSFESRARRIRFNRMVEMSTGLIAGNEYLASFASGRPILVAPSPVPHEVPQKRHAPQTELRIGWVGLGRNLSALLPLRPVFEALKGTARLTVISNERFDGFPNRHIPWSLEAQDAAVAELDVGIMPLDVDSPFTRGKCSYKLLQYMAAGVPCVASPIGMNTEVIRPGDNGFLAHTTSEWIARLSELCASAELRAQLGASGRRDVEARYTYPAIADRWTQFLTSL
jgi:hypothetical protein